MCNRDKQYMRIAKIWSENSHAIRHKVGAIIVKDNMIISDGYNGMPSGFDNCCEIVECESPLKYGGTRKLCRNCEIVYPDMLTYAHCNDCPHCKLVTKPEVLHAEANAITKLSKSTQSSIGSTLYVTMSPCIECAKLIIQAGVSKVYYDEIYRNTDGLDLLNKAGIETIQLDMSKI